ncbi:MAG: hypothetical protein ACP5D1_08555 [Bacteroidales bacterium]
MNGSAKTLKNMVPAMLLIMLFAPACKRQGEKGSARESRKETYVRESIESKVREFVYPLPTAFEVTEMLKEIGANYILTLTNSVKNADKYFTEKSKALNLGIYAADLAYNSTYQQKQETMFYMEASKKLSDGLGISGVLTEELAEKVEDNINDKEKLVEIITNAFYDTYDELNRTGKGNLSLLVIAGSWVEALYITTNISENVYHNLEIVKIIHQQKETLNKLWSILEENQNGEYIHEIMDELQPVKDIYDNLDQSLSEKDVIAITQEISRIREKFVS